MILYLYYQLVAFKYSLFLIFILSVKELLQTVKGLLYQNDLLRRKDNHITDKEPLKDNKTDIIIDKKITNEDIKERLDTQEKKLNELME